jgi:uncharacterized membrane protein
LVKWLLGGNTVVRAGVVILFFGVAFLLKFAYEHSHLPVEARLVGVCIGAILLLALGWRLRIARPGYALTLQGGGVGMLSLTIFAAFRLYAVLPAVPAFGLLVLIAAFSAVLAVLQDSRALAILGVSGGFLAPVLASTGHGSHVMLFSYYVVLNLGIVAIAWKKAWRELNLVGFAFTFVIGLAWGFKYYQPDFLATTEPFLVVFFLLYLALPLLFARQHRDRLAPYVDATLVFGVPAAAFGLQAALVRDLPYGLAWSALALGSTYLLLASLLWRRTGQERRLLTETFLALGSGFATLCIPLAFDGRATSAVWAVEGAAVVWIGLRQNRPLARAAGYLLQFAAGAAFALGAPLPGAGIAFLNSFYLGCFLMSCGAAFCSIAISRAGITARHATEPTVAAVLLVWGLLWWAAGGVHEIDRYLGPELFFHASLVYLVLSAAVLSRLARILRWPLARWVAYAVVPLIALVLVADAGRVSHPLDNLGAVAWPLAFAAHLWVLRRQSVDPLPLQDLLHPAGVWLLAALLTWEAHWQAGNLVGGSAVWGVAALGLVAAAMLCLLDAGAAQRIWPLAANPHSYRVTAARPVAAGLLLWILWANVMSDGDPAPLPYLPLFNPLDVAVALAFLTLLHWWPRGRGAGASALPADARQAALALAGGAGFIWANAALLRSVHHWAGVPFTPQALWSSVLVQAALALFWSLGALLLMTLAARRALRDVWLAGAVLMGIVVAKLFLVDLSDVGGVERIVSFIGVGALMLVIGYIAPVPPRRVGAAANDAGGLRS